MQAFVSVADGDLNICKEKLQYSPHFNEESLLNQSLEDTGNVDIWGISNVLQSSSSTYQFMWVQNPKPITFVVVQRLFAGLNRYQWSKPGFILSDFRHVEVVLKPGA